ncbi:DUF3458 domain-containing protein, partial [Salmonella enterica subsp. enterica serovar Java]
TPATADQAEKQPLHIPFAIELYDNEGNVIPLQKGGHPVNAVLFIYTVFLLWRFCLSRHEPLVFKFWGTYCGRVCYRFSLQG